MPRQVAFIRAVMVGRAGIDRSMLIDAFASAGARAPRSHLATGNVSFDADDAALGGIVAGVESVLAATAGAAKPLFVRRLDDLAGYADLRRWPEDADAYEHCVTFLSPGARLDVPLPHRSPRGDFEILAADAGEVYSLTRLISGRPGNPGAWLERVLGAAVTTRNRRTLERILRAHT